MSEPVDIHELSARIHGWNKDTADHWDALICKYLRSEVVEPLATAQLELASKLAELTHAIEKLRARLDDSGALKPEENRLLNAHEAGKMLKVHPRTVIELAKQGKIEGKRIGNGQWRFRKNFLEVAKTG